MFKTNMEITQKEIEMNFNPPVKIEEIIFLKDGVCKITSEGIKFIWRN